MAAVIKASSKTCAWLCANFSDFGASVKDVKTCDGERAVPSVHMQVFTL